MLKRTRSGDLLDSGCDAAIFIMNGDKQNTVICVLCKTELQRGEDKSTSQMKNHLQREAQDINT